MNLWTDGTQHIQTAERARRVRRFQDHELVATWVSPLPRECPLVVHPSRNRVYVGHPLMALRLDTLEVLFPVQVPDHLKAATAWGTDEAAVVTHGRDGSSRLHLGAIGALREVAVLDFPTAEVHRVDPLPRFVGERFLPPVVHGGLVVRGNRRGIALADATSGVVAVLRPQTEAFELWQVPGTTVQRLVAEPTAEGALLTVSQGARSAVLRLRRGKKPLMVRTDDGDLRAHYVHPRHMLVHHDNLAARQRLSGAVEEAIVVRGFVSASAAARGRLVLANTDGIKVVDLRPGMRGSVRTLPVDQRYDLTAAFSELAQNTPARLQQALQLAHPPDVRELGSRVLVTLRAVREDVVEEARRLLEQHGGSHVVVTHRRASAPLDQVGG